jgi:hypothetical protein
VSDQFPSTGTAIGGPSGFGRAQSPVVVGPATVGRVAAGRVGDIAALLEEKAFFSWYAARYRAAGFGTPGAAEERSWRNSWPCSRPCYGQG